MSDLRIISAEVKEEPHYFKVTKGHILGTQIGREHFGFPELKYDPFPQADIDDVVQTEIVGRKLILSAKIRGNSDTELMLHAINFHGHKFAIKSVTSHFGMAHDDHLLDVEGEAFIVLHEPSEVLKQIVLTLAAGNPQ